MVRLFSMYYHIALAIFLLEVGASLARFRGTGFFEEFHNGFCCYLGFGSVPLTNNNDASSRSMWRHSTAVSGVACPPPADDLFRVARLRTVRPTRPLAFRDAHV
ncbi:hypothetical protein LSAT2_016713 [Lamellibrachia satsuma]|nr:hypothetical protein LSAT2_016713 [Lamellibrachia satsuma]